MPTLRRFRCCFREKEPAKKSVFTELVTVIDGGGGEGAEASSPPEPKVATLTGFEKRFGQAHVYRAIWVFPDQRPNSKWMKESLARILPSCPILAARARTENQNSAVAVLDNSGVRFTEVAWPPNTSIEDTFGSSSLESSLGFCKEKPQGYFCDIPDASAVMQGKEPLMTVQVNIFPDGFLLGVAMSHAVSDATSFYSFVADWSHLHRDMLKAGSFGPAAAPSNASPFDLDAAAPPYVWDRELVFPSTNGTTAKETREALDMEDPPLRSRSDLFMRRLVPMAMKSLAKPTRAPVRLMVHFPKYELAAIKKRATSGAVLNENLSTNDALCGHIAQCISEHLGIKGATAFNFTIQMRGRMSVYANAAAEEGDDNKGGDEDLGMEASSSAELQRAAEEAAPPEAAEADEESREELQEQILSSPSPTDPLDLELKGDSPSAAAGPHSPLLPDRYMGNPLLLLTATVSQAPHQMPLQEVASAIRSKIDSLDPEEARHKMQLADACLRHSIFLLPDDGKASNSIGFNSLQGVPAYDVDFGGGTPRLCLPGYLGDFGNSVLLFPAPIRHGGVVAYLYLGNSKAKTESFGEEESLSKLHKAHAG